VFISLSRLVIALIIVRLANAEIFGNYVVVMSIIFIGEWLMDFGTTDIAVRNISQNTNRRISILHAVTAIKVLQAVIGYCVVVFAIYFLGYTELLPATGIGGFAIIFYGGALIYRVSFRLNMSMYKDMLSESSGVMVMILLVLFLSLKGASVAELVTCHTLSRLIYLIGNIYLGSKDYKLQMTFSGGQQFPALIKQAAPLGITGILVVCYDSIFPLVLSKLLNMEAVGQYTVAIRLVFPIVLIAQAVNNVFYTPLASHWLSDKKQFASTQQNLVEITCVIACGFFCLIYSGAVFIVSFFGDSMSESAWILRALSWAILARAMTIAMSSPIIICGGQRKTMWLTFIVLIFSALLVIYLVPIYGIIGAVGAYLFVEIVITAIPVIFVSLYMANYRLSWLPVIKIFVATGISIAITSSSRIDGTAIGSIISVILFASIAYSIGGISNQKIRTLIDIVKNRSTSNS